MNLVLGIICLIGAGVFFGIIATVKSFYINVWPNFEKGGRH